MNNKNKVLVLGLSALGFGAVFGGGNVSAADIPSNMTINPVYQQYEQDVSNGNGSNWDVIPSKYIYTGETSGKGGDGILPSSYNLVTEGYGTTLKNQGSDGICWAFATTTAIESNLKKTKGIDVEFSPKQLDYLLAPGTSYYDYTYNKFSSSRTLGTGGNFFLASFAFGGNYSPTTESKFFNKMKANDSSLSEYSSWNDYQNRGSINEVITNTDRTAYTKTMDSATIMSDAGDYVVTKYRNYEYTYDGLVNEIKNNVYNYGASYVGTVSPLTTGCWDADTKTIVDRGTSICGTGGHAMAIVGWDDNHSYTDPETGQTKTGAFLLQNSWGKSTIFSDYGYDYESLATAMLEAGRFPGVTSIEDLPAQTKTAIQNLVTDAKTYEYLWLAYDFEDDKDKGALFNAVAVEEVQENNYKNIYDTPNQTTGFGGLTEQVSEIVNSFTAGDEPEYINALSIDTHLVTFDADVEYVLYVDATGTGNDYQEAGRATIAMGEIGKETIKLNNKIEVSGDFKVKVMFVSGGEFAAIPSDFVPYITLSAYTVEGDTEEWSASESGIIGVPNTGLFSGENGGAQCVAMATGAVVLCGLGIVTVKNRKNWFHKVKFGKK